MLYPLPLLATGDKKSDHVFYNLKYVVIQNMSSDCLLKGNEYLFTVGVICMNEVLKIAYTKNMVLVSFQLMPEYVGLVINVVQKVGNWVIGGQAQAVENNMN